MNSPLPVRSSESANQNAPGLDYFLPYQQLLSQASLASKSYAICYKSETRAARLPYVAIRRSSTGTGPGKLESNPTIPNRFYRLGGGYPGGNLARLEILSSAIGVLGSSVLFALPATPENPVATD